MNTPISELSNIALSVSHTLKCIDPKNFFMTNRIGDAFNNFNMLEIKPPSNVRKPFGVQAVLESFAKSVGFKTYNGLLNSGLTSIQLRCDALNHLNPNPLNLYFTNIWECLCFAIMDKAINNELLSIKAIQNFKKNEYVDLLVYQDKSIFNYVDFENQLFMQNSELDPIFFIEDRVKKIIHYYPIASYIYCMAVEKLIELNGCSDWFKAESINLKTINDRYDELNSKIYQEIRIPLADMLIKDQLDGDNSWKFLQDITFAMAELFSVVVRFEGHSRSLSDKVAVFKIKKNQIIKMMIARFNKYYNEIFREACVVVLKEIDGDSGFYSCDLIENNNLSFIPVSLKLSSKHINHNYKGIHLNAVNGENIFGKKAFWINTSHKYIYPFRGDGMYSQEYFRRIGKKLIDKAECIDLIRTFLKAHLKPVVVIEKKNLSFGGGSPFKQTYTLLSNNKELSKIIPRYLSLDSEYPLDHYIGEVFIQNLLMGWIAKQTKINVDNKSIGHPDLMCFAGKETITIKKTLAKVASDDIYQFFCLNMVEIIGLYFDVNLEEKVGLPVNTIENKQLYYETENEIYFSLSLCFPDMLYKFDILEDTFNARTEIAMLATINKKTKKISLSPQAMCDEDINSNPLFGYNECPNSQRICDFLIGMNDIHELIYEYFMLFYNGKYKGILDTVNKYDTILFEIFPKIVTQDGYDLADILDLELNII